MQNFMQQRPAAAPQGAFGAQPSPFPGGGRAGQSPWQMPMGLQGGPLPGMPPQIGGVPGQLRDTGMSMQPRPGGGWEQIGGMPGQPEGYRNQFGGTMGPPWQRPGGSPMGFTNDIGRPATQPGFGSPPQMGGMPPGGGKSGMGGGKGPQGPPQQLMSRPFPMQNPGFR